MVGIMAVTVHKSVNSVCIRDNIRIGPGLTFRLISDMPHYEDVIRAISPCRVHRALYRVVHALSGFVLEKSVYIVSVLILEILRSRACQRFRCRYADKTDLIVSDFLNNIRVKNQLSLFIKVAADIREFGPVH